MIKVQNLGFAYGSVPVLKNITMELQEGKIYGLLGENGVGKTTLLTLLSGLKKPQVGTIDSDGEVPFDRHPSFLEETIYLPDEVAPEMDTAIHWAKVMGNFYHNYSMADFNELMSIFEMDSKKKMNAMSAGQLKKTYIAFCLACHTKYLFLDEPTNGLDIPGKAQFRSAITKYTSETSTIVISTHQVRDLENIIDPIIILDKQEVLINADIKTISDKLFFDYGTTLHPDSLYSEMLPGGFIQVYPNTTGEESKVSIEALFNAVHSHKEIIKALF